MDINSALMSLLSNLQEKYKLLNKIFEATRGLESVSLDDEKALASFLNARQVAMNSIDKLDAANKDLLTRLPVNVRDKVNKLLSPKGEPMTLENPLQTNIFDTNKRNIMLLKRIIDADKRFNKNVINYRNASSLL